MGTNRPTDGQTKRGIELRSTRLKRKRKEIEKEKEKEKEEEEKEKEKKIAQK